MNARHHSCRKYVILFGLALAPWFGSSTARAQSSGPFKAGDDVQVLHLSKWIPAKVVETNRRGDVMAEYEFAGRQQRGVFRKADVRFAYEADALAPARTWSDESGQFSIRAALIRLDEGTVTLRKADMQEVKVPVSKLSEADQTFLKRLEKNLGPGGGRPPDPPPLEQFDRSLLTQPDTRNSIQAARTALSLDPIPAYVALQEGGVAFPTADSFDQLGALLPLGGMDSWLLSAVENGHPGSQGPTRLLWASLKKKEIGGHQLLPIGEVVLDYHPSSHRLLTYSSAKPDNSLETVAMLSIWEVLPADKQAQPIVRWNATPDKDLAREPWGRLITRDVAVHRWKKQEYVGWDIASKRIRYRISQESFFAPLATLSGGRKYLFLPEDKGIEVYDASSGEQVSTLPSDDGAAAVALTEDGQRAAVLGRTTLTIWDLTNSSVAPERIQAEAIGSPFQSKLNWVDGEHVMAENFSGQVLFSLKHKVALWNYQFDGDAVRESEGRRIRDVVAGHLVYAASVRSGTQRGLAVGAVKLPGPKVAQAASTLNPDTLMVLKRGTPVKLDVRAGSDTARVKKALEQEIAANGWVLSPSAKITVLAEMRQGETQQVTYRMTSFSRGGSTETVTVTPYISEVRVDVDGKIAWQSLTSSGAPPFMMLKEGESVQNEVSKWQRPYPEFFDKLDLPERILHPDKRLGLGKTQVTNRGLVTE